MQSTKEAFIIRKMGCSPVQRKPQPPTSADEGRNDIIAQVTPRQISYATRRPSHRISLQEQEIIIGTLTKLQQMDDSDRKQHWFHVIQNEVLYPLVRTYYKALTLTSFTPDPSLVERLKQKDFDHFSIEHEDMIVGMMSVLYAPAQSQGVSETQLEKFLRTVGINYLNNPFHCFRHAFSVVQILYSMSALTKDFAGHLTPIEYFTLLVAALGHDLDHRETYAAGVTNAFLINSNHCLARRYNDTSVLENHHTATLLQILEARDTGLFMGLAQGVTPSQEQRSCRKSLIQTILSTDLANHTSVMSSFTSTVNDFNRENGAHRQNIMNMLLHTADVGNPCLDFSIARKWSMQIIEEFNAQVLREEELKIPVSEFLRVGSELSNVKKSQVGFIGKPYADFIILPLWKLVEVAFPELEAYRRTTEVNRDLWANLPSL
jgi:hypothetical protein